jgi:hypothetical protein
MKSAIDLVRLVVLIASAASAIASPFQNGSFELPDILQPNTHTALFEGDTTITGWRVGGNGDGLTWHNGTNSDQPVNAFEGKYLVGFGGGGSLPGRLIEQTFDTLTGQQYVVRFEVAQTGSGGISRVSAEIFSQTGQVLASTQAVGATSNWTEITLIFTATTTESKIRFTDASINAFSSDLLLDNVSITKIFLSNGLIAYYPFHGNANDESGNGNNGIIHGATLTTDRFGQAGGAYLFNGTSIEMNGPLPESNSASVSVWINSQQAGGRGFIFFEGDDTNGRDFGLAFNPDSSIVFITKDNTSVSVQAPTNKWIHIVSVADVSKGQLQLWMNGSLVSSNLAFTGPANVGYNYKLQIGRLAGGVTSTDFFKGKIDDLRFYDRVLSETEITELFHTPQPFFTRVTDGDVATTPARSTGVAWIDYDNDGKLDLFASYYGGGNLLFRNIGESQFDKISAGNLVTDVSISLSGAWGDYDNDGLIDVFVASLVDQEPAPPNRLYRNRGQGNFTLASGSSFAEDVARSVSASWADFDADGNLDLFVANSRPDQVNFLYRNRGDGTFGRVLNDIVGNEVVVSDTGSWSDYDKDGDLDLFVTSEGGNSNRLYRNNGKGTFTKITSGPLVNEGGSSAGCAWGDYNNDGFPDLFVANLKNANNFLYRNNGNGSFTKVTSGIVVNDGGDSVGCAWGDFDNDGWLDLFVANYGGQKNALYRNNGDGTFTKVTSEPVANDIAASRGCAWGDYDNDGWLDLVVSNDGNHPCFLYHNNGNTNHWLKVTCTGTASNRSAIGAKVRVQAKIMGSTLWQMREISGGSGYGSQNALETHFGLGDATNVISLEIEWPSGIRQRFHDLASNQTLSINEPPVLSNPIMHIDGSFEFTLESRFGLNYRIEASANLLNWREISTVRDVRGAIQIVDTNNHAFPRRFYQAVQIP